MIQGTKINLDNKSAVVLHHYNYRDSSLIVNFFLSDFGLVSAVAKGIKGKKNKQNQFVLLQPFKRLKVSLTGKNDLLILTSVELSNVFVKDLSSQVWDLSGKPLYCAYYINELLLRLLPSHTNCYEIFSLYEHTLDILSHFSSNNSKQPSIGDNEEVSIQYEVPLRMFEIKLLEYLGYALNLSYDVETNLVIESDKQYYYILDTGPTLIPVDNIKNLVISGSTLINMSNHQFTDQKTLQESKQLLKWALAVHLGEKPLKSREMFKQLYC
ncbi:MAG: DNA repair protein RecO [Gammaproteobacteria bacterium]|nr:DNA repair protein RecO [Gammaproteobacteria bacterium]